MFISLILNEESNEKNLIYHSCHIHSFPKIICYIHTILKHMNSIFSKMFVDLGGIDHDIQWYMPFHRISRIISIPFLRLLICYIGVPYIMST